MTHLTDKQLTDLGFKLLPEVREIDDDDGFSYRVAEIKKEDSFLEVINEYRNGKLTKQFMNYQINQYGYGTPPNINRIKKLKETILKQL